MASASTSHDARNDFHTNDGPNKIAHYHLGGRGGGGGFFRGTFDFFKEHRSTVRKLIGLLLILLVQRLFRSFLFTCPCLPAQGGPLKGNTSLVVLHKPLTTWHPGSYYPSGLEPTSPGEFVSPDPARIISAVPEPDPRAPPPGSPLKLATDPRYSRTKAELRDANTRFRRSYGLIFLLLPAACLFLFKLCLSTKAWKVLTGCCHSRKDAHEDSEASTSKNVTKPSKVRPLQLLKIIGSALIPAIFWIIVSLMDGRFLVCAYSTHPCNPAHYNNREVKAKTQIIGWILLITLAFLLAGLYLLRSLCSKRNYYENRFARIYDGREENEVDRVSRLTAKALAVQNVANFFNYRPAGNQRWWERFAPSDNLRRTLGLEPAHKKTKPRNLVSESRGHQAPAHLDTGAPAGHNDEAVRFLGNDIEIDPNNVAENLPGDYYVHPTNGSNPITPRPPLESSPVSTGYHKLDN